MLSDGSILTLSHIIISYMGGELLMELMLSDGSIQTSHFIIMSTLGAVFLMELMLSEGSIVAPARLLCLGYAKFLNWNSS